MNNETKTLLNTTALGHSMARIEESASCIEGARQNGDPSCARLPGRILLDDPTEESGPGAAASFAACALQLAVLARIQAKPPNTEQVWCAERGQEGDEDSEGKGQVEVDAVLGPLVDDVHDEAQHVERQQAHGVHGHHHHDGVLRATLLEPVESVAAGGRTARRGKGGARACAVHRLGRHGRRRH